MIAYDAPVTALKGIGPRSAEELRSLGILTAGDLLRFFPAAYDRPEAVIRIEDVPSEEICAIQAKLESDPVNRGFGKQTVTSFSVSDGSGSVRVSFFHMPYLKNSLKKGEERVFRGVVRDGKYGLQMDHPKIFKPEEYASLSEKIWPVYASGDAVSQKKLRSAIAQALSECEIKDELLPEKLVQQGWMTERSALQAIHFPKTEDELIRARQRLVFEEFLIFLLRIRLLKSSENKENDYPMPESTLAEQFRRRLPFQLTDAQEKVWAQIKADIAGDCRMNRLIQGDVGSGKTVLAVMALLAAAENGYQGALMAPTEVLAQQHFDKITKLFDELKIPVRPVLLTGSVKESAKKVIREELKDGRAQIAVGTHALIQDKVLFQNLGLVITDEQHRFGVRQREMLGEKGGRPHMLVMSATPIPRTLAIILYGDLDISVIDKLPVGRLPIKNAVVKPTARGSVYRLILNEIAAGHQAYVICPFVEESESLSGENVEDYAEKLKAVLPSSVRLGVLHGRMPSSEKNRVMERFQRGEIQILVSTTVVEVGVDVPNATVMMVENAERFGLAQLHQLRGRVGRGEAQSYAVFMDGSGKGKKKERLEILNQTNDGFKIAEEDLKLRGPGDVFGVRQSGDLHFNLGDIYQDHDVLMKASEAASQILNDDPKLNAEENRRLREQVNKLLGKAEAL